MSTINDSDLLAVERSGTLYQIRRDELSTLNDTDLLAIERSGTLYKIEAQDMELGPTGTLETPVAVLTPVNGAGVGTGVPYNPLSSAITTVGSGGSVTFQTQGVQSVSSPTWTTTIASQNTNASGGLNSTTGLFNVSDIHSGPGYAKQNQPTGTYIEVVFTDNQGPTIVANGLIGFVSNYEAGRNHSGYVEFMGGTQASLSFSGNAGHTEQLPFTGSGVIKKIRITRTGSPYTTGATHSTRITQVWADGQQVLDGSPVVLTFPSDQNINRFQAGDVVRSNFNKSRVWSNSLSVAGSWDGGSGPTYAFDGNPSSNSRSMGWPNMITFDISSNPLTFSDTVKIYSKSTSANVSVNGGTASQIAQNQWVTIASGGGTLNTITLVDSNSKSNIVAIKVDDKELVDTGVTSSNEVSTAIVSIDSTNNQITTDGGTWSVGDTLSKDVPYEASLICTDNTKLNKMVGPLTMTDSTGAVKTPETSAVTNVQFNNYTADARFGYSGPDGIYVIGNLFDGNPSTFAAPANDADQVIFEPSTSIPYSSSVEVYTNSPNSTTYLNGTGASTGSAGWYTIGTGSGVINKINIEKAPGSSRPYLGAIRVDGVVLVNNTTLTFTDDTDLEYFNTGDELDLWNQSQTWSNNCNAVSNPTKATNGNLNDFAETSGGTSQIVLSNIGGLSGLVRVYVGTSGGHRYQISTNDGTTVTTATSWGGGFVTVGTASNITTITTTRIEGSTTNPTNDCQVYGYEIAGKLLVDQGISNTNPVSVVSVDTANNSMVVDSGTYAVGNTVATDPLSASATTVFGVDGTTLKIDGVSGTWLPGLYIKGSTVTDAGPHPNSIVFTSSNGGTTAVTGTNATLASRVWTLETGSSATGPWTLVNQYIDTDPVTSQDGSTTWSGKPTLSPNTHYRVKVKYTSDNAVAVESTFNTFRVGAS